MTPEEEMAMLIEKQRGQGVAVVKQPSEAIKVPMLEHYQIASQQWYGCL